MGGYRGGALGFKAASFHAMVQTFSAQAEVSTCARSFLGDFVQNDLAFENSHLGQYEESWPLFEWRRMMRFGHLTVTARLRP
jgi:hypothetical protein